MEKETKNSSRTHNTNADDDEDDLDEKSRHRYEQIDHSRHSRQQQQYVSTSYGEIPPPHFQNAESRAQYEEYIHQQYGDQYNIYHRNPYFQYMHPGYRHVVTHEHHGEESATNDESNSIHEQHHKGASHELREHVTHRDDGADNVHAAEENHHTIQESNKTIGRSQKKSLKRPRESQKEGIYKDSREGVLPKNGENDRNGAHEKTVHESKEMTTKMNQKSRGRSNNKDKNDDSDDDHGIARIQIEEAKVDDPVIIAQNALIDRSTPSSELEIALYAALARKEYHISRLTREILKFKKFITKRKQTYKRKRKEDNAPTRPLSAYNIYIQDRFARLAKDNEKALKSDDADAQMMRVPPANLVAATGNQWKELPAEEKQKYEERAQVDRDRYDQEMTQYQAPDKQANRKRNKTGYNMFFTAHVLRMRQTDNGVPSERGFVARDVGVAWKALPADEKAYYEREADKHNGLHPVKDGDEDDDEDDEEDDELKRQAMEQYQTQHDNNADIHMHSTLPPSLHPALAHPGHETRHSAYYHPAVYAVPQPYGHYDYSQHQRHQQARAQGYQQSYPPPGRHAYEGI